MIVPTPIHQKSAHVVEQNGADHDEQIVNTAPSVEEKAECKKHRILELKGYKEVKKNYCGKKIKQKRYT